MNAGNTAQAEAISSSFVQSVGSVIHATLPHNSAALDAISLLVVVVAAASAALHQWWTGRKWPPEQFIRVGFAAAPLPVYLFLPCLPFDKDLADMFADERILLALAAASGFMWTLKEIRGLFREERVKPPNAN